jgi:hypothetical protein
MRLTWLAFCLCTAAALAIGTANAVGEPPAANSVARPAGQEVPPWLFGVWTRNWIEEQGRKSSTLDVHYLQTPKFFGDVRIPIDRPKFPHATSFADLTDRELQSLARQLGSAGPTTVVGTKVTWHHLIDFEPPDGQEDAGRIEIIAPDQMYEHGLDGSYTESWRSATDGNGRFLVLQTESGGRTLRLLLVAGDYFLYVRNREKDLPPATSLEVLIKDPGTTRARVIEYLDCEFSLGRVRGKPVSWEIQSSTLPWREGRRLDFVDQLELEADGVGFRLRTTRSERLTTAVNTFTRSELASLFSEFRASGPGGRPQRPTLSKSP